MATMNERKNELINSLKKMEAEMINLHNKGDSSFLEELSYQTDNLRKELAGIILLLSEGADPDSEHEVHEEPIMLVFEDYYEEDTSICGP